LISKALKCVGGPKTPLGELTMRSMGKQQGLFQRAVMHKMWSDERKYAVTKGCFCNDEPRRNKILV